MGEDGTYGGLFGAFPYAFRKSESLLFRTYVLASAISGLYIAILLVLGIVVWIADPLLVGDKALLGVVGILVLGPLVAPVLVIARRYRLGIERPEADWLFGLVGYAFFGALYTGILITDPADHDAGWPLGSVFTVLDDIPDVVGLLPPIIGALAIYAVIRRTR